MVSTAGIEILGGGEGGEVRNFRNFSAMAFCLSPLRALLVPFVSPVQKCCSLRLRKVWLQHHNFAAISLQFSAIFHPDRHPPNSPD